MTIPTPATPPFDNRIGRCAACGNRFASEKEFACRFCGTPRAENALAGDDRTPFGRAEKRGRTVRKEMWQWVACAGTERLAHLTRIRRSHASRDFALFQLWVMLTAVVLFQLNRLVWQRVTVLPDGTSLVSVSPSGRGWILVAASRIETTATRSMALWWNVARTAVAVPILFVTGGVAVWGNLFLLNVGASIGLPQRLRKNAVLTGAVDYSTAWITPMFLASALLLLIPLRDALSIIGMTLLPPASIIRVSAALITGLAGLAWWFWLIRAAMTLPPRERNGPVVYYAVIVPILVAALIGGWLLGVERLFEFLWPLFNLQW